MKANELRIGNLFVDKKTKTIINIIGLTEQYITFSGHFKNDWQAKPIPLTEEWLLKFGFKNLSIGLFELIHNNVIGYRLSIEGQYGYEEIKYIHQLQNLYFALTGEELTIK